MFNRNKKNKIDNNEENKLTFKDTIALVIAAIQVLLPYVLISIAVFSFLVWLLLKFWVNQ